MFAGCRIERVIGRGGMGIVYLAKDPRLDRPVALKVLTADRSGDPSARERFVAESRLAASIDHPSIVPIYGAGEERGQLWISMRFIDGLDLRSLILLRGSLEAGYAVGLLSQVADALDTAHARGLVHRDVKPSNILVEPARSAEVVIPSPDHDVVDLIGKAGDHAFLTDFGLTRRASEASTSTSADRFLGTVDYVAPEQIEGGAIDGLVDQYGLAATLYACLTGKPPFERDLELATLHAHVRQPPPKATDARPDLPATVDHVLAKGMSKDPAARFASVSKFMAAFGAALQGHGLETTGPIPVGSARQPGRAGRRLAIAVAAVAAVRSSPLARPRP